MKLGAPIAQHGVHCPVLAGHAHRGAVGGAVTGQETLAEEQLHVLAPDQEDTRVDAGVGERETSDKEVDDGVARLHAHPVNDQIGEGVLAGRDAGNGDEEPGEEADEGGGREDQDGDRSVPP